MFKFNFKKKESIETAIEVPKHIAVIMDGNGRWAKSGCSHVLWGIRLVWMHCKRLPRRLLIWE